MPTSGDVIDLELGVRRLRVGREHIRVVSPQRVVGTRGNIGTAVLAQVRETIALLLDLP